jgi:hypothetical protein
MTCVRISEPQLASGEVRTGVGDRSSRKSALGGPMPATADLHGAQRGRPTPASAGKSGSRTKTARPNEARGKQRVQLPVRACEAGGSSSLVEPTVMGIRRFVEHTT